MSKQILTCKILGCIQLHNHVETVYDDGLELDLCEAHRAIFAADPEIIWNKPMRQEILFTDWQY